MVCDYENESWITGNVEEVRQQENISEETSVKNYLRLISPSSPEIQSRKEVFAVENITKLN